MSCHFLMQVALSFLEIEKKASHADELNNMPVPLMAYKKELAPGVLLQCTTSAKSSKIGQSQSNFG